MYQFVMKNKLALAAFAIFILAVGQLFVGGEGSRELYASTEPPADLAQSNRQAAMDEIGIESSPADGELVSEEVTMDLTPDEDLIDSAEGFDPTPEEEPDFFEEDGAADADASEGAAE